MTVPGPKDPLDVAALTNNQPFCAGVVLLREGRILATLNPDGLPESLQSTTCRIGGVGGGQEPGETLKECALREAEEETTVKVELIHSPSTFFHDMDTGLVSEITVRDVPAPVLLERMTDSRPNTPYRPGLPTGPYIYFGQFLAGWRTGAKELRPGDDVRALFYFPVDRWNELKHPSTPRDLTRRGGGLHSRPRI
ncbi:NUDIX domain-containing protein [Melghirimyces profundicolus]|uniref:NUDIX domain-containing protein n=1 Tax=Melghirimyces profundicolus TaxID=1242148 RepID=A0A2T6BQE5_9BACL|nr:NUDIX domain-containing protein [Melghirimyces profundicolus]PTX58323.1 NUDIX domain-containing protein [Melghirimyces profundicolus]